MLRWIRHLLAPPTFDDDEKTRAARLLNAVLIAFGVAMLAIVAAILIFIGLPSTSEDIMVTVGGTVIAIVVGALLILVRRGQTGLASIVLTSMIWIIITGWIFTVAGIGTDASPLAYPLIIALGGLLLGGSAALIYTGFSCVAIAGAYLAEINGWLVPSGVEFNLGRPVVMIVELVLMGLLLRYAVDSMLDGLQRARENEQAQREANQALQALRASLEDRVSERTRDLELRSAQLQAAVEIGTVATSVLDPEELMWRVAELILRQFDLYHVGLFLLDPAGQWAVYLAGAGQEAQILARQPYRLAVGGNSLVGWCTEHGKVRVVDDVRTDIQRANHPLVPETRSEAVLPLLARGQVIGAISIQSRRISAFDEDTLASLRTIADQVAVAVDNARLFTESQEALEATRRAYGELTHDAWFELLRSHEDWGYEYSQRGISSVQGEWAPEMLEALDRGETVTVHQDDGVRLSIPIQIRDEVIGVLSFAKDQAGSGSGWTKEERALLERTAEQMGLALESAQFFESTQQRAAREAAIRQATERMRRAVDVETILQNAVSDLAESLGVPVAYVHLGTEDELFGEKIGKKE